MSKRDRATVGVVVPAPGTGPAKDFDHRGWLESVGLQATAKAVRERDEAVEALVEARKQRDDAVGLVRMAYGELTTGTTAWRILREHIDRLDAEKAKP